MPEPAQPTWYSCARVTLHNLLSIQTTRFIVLNSSSKQPNRIDSTADSCCLAWLLRDDLFGQATTLGLFSPAPSQILNLVTLPCTWGGFLGRRTFLHSTTLTVLSHRLSVLYSYAFCGAERSKAVVADDPGKATAVKQLLRKRLQQAEIQKIQAWSKRWACQPAQVLSILQTQFQERCTHGSVLA